MEKGKLTAESHRDIERKRKQVREKTTETTVRSTGRRGREVQIKLYEL